MDTSTTGPAPKISPQVTGDVPNPAAAAASVPIPPGMPHRSPSQTSIGKSPSHISSHRQSFAENLRNAPGSPRSQRHPSFTQAAVQELLNHPPAPHKTHHNSRFAGRDWHDISINELVAHEDVRWATLDSTVEEASMVQKAPCHYTLQA